MPRFYDPKTGTEALEGIHDLEGTTKDSDMPEESRLWFERPAREGHRWENDPTGKYPVEVPIPPPTSDELAATERAWAQQELAATDAAMLPDSPYSDEHRQSIQNYRQALRNPNRTDTAGFPEQSWRPTWPDNVKRPGE